MNNVWRTGHQPISWLMALLAASMGVISKGLEISCLFISVYSLFHWKQWQVSRDNQYFSLFLIIAALFLTGITSFYYDGPKVMDTPSRYLLALPLIALLPSTKINMGLILKGFVIGAILSGILASFQSFVLGYPRAAGHFNSIYFGFVTSLQALGSVCAAMYFYSRRSHWFVPGCLAILMGILAMVLSGTRGSWVAFLPSVALILILRFHWFDVKYIVAVLGVGVLVAFLSYTFISPVQGRIYDIFSDIAKYSQGNAQTSVGARLEMWRSAIREFQEAPIFGLGFKRRTEFDRHLRLEGYQTSDRGEDSLHNEVFDAMAKRGFVGLLAILAAYFFSLRLFIHYYRQSDDQETQLFSIVGVFWISSYMLAGLTERFLFNHIAATLFAFSLPAFWASVVQRDQ